MATVRQVINARIDRDTETWRYWSDEARDASNERAYCIERRDAARQRVETMLGEIR